jgi:hypothetical protein
MGKRYPAIARAWDYVVPLFAFPPAIRKMIYTTRLEVDALGLPDSAERRRTLITVHQRPASRTLIPAVLDRNRSPPEIPTIGLDCRTTHAITFRVMTSRNGDASELKTLSARSY